ncbi:MAG: hypothetical protein U9N84_12600, partial [Actinomycetota bacterium]|nr:hypothetical protein [Actinomycetota bacterium]
MIAPLARLSVGDRLANRHGCDERLWLTLARAREDTNPHESIPIYRQAALREIEKVNRRGYENAIGHLDRIHRMALQMG